MLKMNSCLKKVLFLKNIATAKEGAGGAAAAGGGGGGGGSGGGSVAAPTAEDSGETVPKRGSYTSIHADSVCIAG